MDPQLERDTQFFWSLLFAIIADGEKRLAAHMAAHDLTPPQFYVLKTLVEQGGRCRIGQIARLHHLTNATMTGLIKRLEALEPPLVTRERGPDDLRAVVVVLTPAGRARFEDVRHSLLEQARDVLRLIGPDERTQLFDFLGRYVDVVTRLFPVESGGEDGA